MAATVITATDLGNGLLQYQINFNGAGNSPAGGNWQSANLTDSAGQAVGQLSLTANPAAIVLQREAGDYALTLTGSYGFWLGADNPAQPITTSAWYYLATSGFTLSGLTAGDTVSLWATIGWDGSGKAPQIDFNGAGNVNLNTASTTIGTNPGTADLVQIASGVVATGSSLSGLLNMPSNGNGEGQIGAFIIQVQSVPEPSFWVLSSAGLSILLLGRRRC